MQADMVLEELRVLYLDLGSQEGTVFCRQPAGGSDSTLVGIANLKAHRHSDALPPTRPPYSNKATPPNSATPCGPSIQTHECIEAKPIQPL